MRTVRYGIHRVASGEVAVRPRGLRPNTVPQPAHALRQAAAPSPIAAYRFGAGHRAALLRPARRQDPHRNADQGHVVERRLVQLAVLADAIDTVRSFSRRMHSSLDDIPG